MLIPFLSDMSAEILPSEGLVMQRTEKLAPSPLITASGMPILEKINLGKGQMCKEGNKRPKICLAFGISFV